MAYDDEDLFDEEFDFVDDDDSDDAQADSEIDELDSEQEEAPPKRRGPAKGAQQGAKRGARKPAPAEDEPDNEFAAEAEEPEAEPVPTGPPADHVVHVYEFGNYKRTIQREFTAEDSIKFAEEFNRTSKNYGRHAVPVERTEEPEPHL